MSITRRLRRAAQLFAVACALLATTGQPASAAAGPLAQERYYMSQPAADPTHGPAAQEQYYSSYGTPEPLSAPQSPAPADQTPWLPIGLAIAGTLLVGAVGATQVRRVRIRRRRAAHTPA